MISMKRCIGVALGMLIVLDSFLYLQAKTKLDHVAQDTTILYRSPDKTNTIGPPDGFNSSSIKVDITRKSNKGWVVRYAAKNCEFCRADEPRWNQMSADLQRLGYSVIFIVPQASEAYPDNSLALMGTREEVYVNLEWVKRFRLSMTPTLLIFAPDQKLLWFHQGALGPADPASAFRTIELWNHNVGR